MKFSVKLKYCFGFHANFVVQNIWKQFDLFVFTSYKEKSAYKIMKTEATVK
jgi:hypothetical protein